MAFKKGGGSTGSPRPQDRTVRGKQAAQGQGQVMPMPMPVVKPKAAVKPAAKVLPAAFKKAKKK